MTAGLTTFPRPTMLIRIVGITHAQPFMLHLTAPAASKRHKGRIATDPLLTTRRFDEWRLGIATEATMFARNGLGCHTVGGHRVSLYGAGRLRPPSGGEGEVHPPPNHCMLWAPLRSNLHSPPWPRAIGVNPSPGDAPIVHTATPSRSVETPSAAARRARARPAPTARAHQG